MKAVWGDYHRYQQAYSVPATWRRLAAAMGLGGSKEQKEQRLQKRQRLQKEKEQRLIDAAKAGDLATVKNLLAGCVNADAGDKVRARPSAHRG